MIKTHRSPALAADSGIKYTHEGEITPGVRCLIYKRRLFLSWTPQSCEAAGLANSRRAVFEPRFATRQHSSETTGQGLQIGPNKTHSRTRESGFNIRREKTA